MDLTPSAHVDTFARDNLPPAEQWPTLEFTLPELQYPERLNAATELIDDAVAQLRRRPPGPAHPGRRGLDLRRAAAPRQPGRPGPDRGPRARARQPGAAALARTTRGWSPPGSASSRPAASSSPPCRRCAPARSAPIVELTRPVVALVDHRFAGRPGRGRRRAGPAGRAPTAATRRRPGRALRRQVRRVHQRRHRGGRRRAARPDLRHHRRRRRSPCTSTATSSPTPTPSPGTSCSRTPDDVFAGSPPLAFTFGLGGLVVFPLRVGACRPAHRARHAGSSWPSSCRGTASPCCPPPRRRTSAILKEGRRAAARRPARRRLAPASTCPRRPGSAVHETHRPEAGQRHRRHRDAARLHLRRRRRHPPRRHRQAGARLPRHDPRTRTATRARPGRRRAGSP